MKRFFQPCAKLINTVTGTEEISTVPTQYSFSLEQEAFEESIEKQIALSRVPLISPDNLLKFLVNKDTNKDSLNVQLISISGNLSALKDKKTYNLSLTRIGRKRKLPMQEPIETVIIRAQQKFEIAGGLNSIQIEIEEDTVVNISQKNIKMQHIN